MSRRWIARIAALGAFVALWVGVAVPADAATKPAQVTGVAKATQDWAGKSVKVKWNAVSGATSYVVKWSTRADLGSPTYKDSTVVGAWMTKLRPGTTYYVTVAAKKGSTAGAWAKPTTTKLQPNAVGTFGTITAKASANSVTVSIPEVTNASDYQVRWSAGPNENRTPDRWTPRWTPWSSAFDPATRTWTLPGSDADLTAVAYGNPIYVRAFARNTYYNSTYVRKSAQVSAWPTPAKPVASDLRVDFASYNVLCSGCEVGGAPGWATRAPAIASTINEGDPDVLTVLEASGRSGGTGSAEAYLDLDRRLPNLELVDREPMTVSSSHQGNRILYNPAKYRVIDHGVLPGVKDYEVYPAAAAPDTNTPWAKLQSKDGSNTTFYVVAAHYGIPSNSYSQPRKTLLGHNSAQLLAALNRINVPNAAGKRLPVVLGGDLNDSRYPEDATDGAQPTLIRGGFYDASASQHRHGTAKATYNNYQPPSKQVDDPNKDGQRIDYILTQGFQGSDDFTNMWNPGTAVIPSDHNMIAATLHVPRVL
ncbi:fibronectin type III domain-containing protein [Curtobacterium sp. NPDC089689]|uniref:fibronectin type III domain-containing protein n=1 Tax=Curtobacterium sp. NPDC089689 TaxID=3363968 RepID=UPI00382D9FD9